ncbi:hypothetical protein SLA2020_095400 [Shorea laevis]
MFVSEIVPMDENATDEIMMEVDIDVTGETVEEEEEIELVDIEFSVDNAAEEYQSIKAIKLIKIKIN